MRFIEDGNFSGWLRVVLFFVGLALAVGGLDLTKFPGGLELGYSSSALG